MTLKIGVTGGIGAGKSVVCKVFKILGAPVYNADSRAKKLMVSDPVIVNQIKNAFGSEAYNSQGKLNRAYLADRVFNDENQVNSLNAIVHPAVALDFASWIKEHKAAPYTINEAALMIESGSYKNMDKIITVSAPIDLRVKRVLERDKQRGKSQIREIIKKQLSENERQNIADFVIINDDVQMVLPQVLKLHEIFLE